jgi:CDP-6-deoxy-D-xylo-4-hexulose-3-dehydrase
MKTKHDLRYGGALVGKEEVDAIMRSVKSSAKTGNWQTGEQARLMEKEAAKQLGVKYGVLTTSGSCAGLLALSALELPRGSEVIIPAVTFPTIFNIILQCGLIPVVVDSKVGTYNLDPDELEDAITDNTKAIIAVHAVGNPCDMRKIMRIARKYKIYVIEDNCDGWGSVIDGKMVGSFGDVSITSFHAAHIVSMGVGGGVFTNSREIAGRVRQYRDWGRQADTTKKHKVKSLPKDYNPRFVYEKIGYNFQILELQAAMGLVQLKKAKKIKAARQKNAEYLMSKLSYLPLIMPETVKGADVCWFALPLTCGVTGERAKLVPFLEKHGIETRSMFSGDITKHPAYADSNYRVAGSLAESDYILRESFWITVHPRLTKSDLDYIVGVFEKYYA